MILSSKFGYLAFANQKVASESMHLLAADDASICFTRIGVKKHIDPIAFERLLIDNNVNIDLSRFFAFSVIREPAPWYVSWFNSRGRQGLADPRHRRHKVYTGNISFDEFLNHAREKQAPPMTRVKSQSFFFQSPKSFLVHAIPMDRIDEVFSTIFPPDASISRFSCNNSDYRVNKSKNLRFRQSQLSESQRKIINEELFPQDYELYLNAQRNVSSLLTLCPEPIDISKYYDTTIERESLSEFYRETAFGIATTLLYRGEEPAQVRAGLQQFQHLDLDNIIVEARKRAQRFLKDS